MILSIITCTIFSQSCTNFKEKRLSIRFHSMDSEHHFSAWENFHKCQVKCVSYQKHWLELIPNDKEWSLPYQKYAVSERVIVNYKLLHWSFLLISKQSGVLGKMCSQVSSFGTVLAYGA